MENSLFKNKELKKLIYFLRYFLEFHKKNLTNIKLLTTDPFLRSNHYPIRIVELEGEGILETSLTAFTGDYPYFSLSDFETFVEQDSDGISFEFYRMTLLNEAMIKALFRTWLETEWHFLNEKTAKLEIKKEKLKIFGIQDNTSRSAYLSQHPMLLPYLPYLREDVASPLLLEKIIQNLFLIHCQLQILTQRFLYQKPEQAERLGSQLLRAGLTLGQYKLCIEITYLLRFQFESSEAHKAFIEHRSIELIQHLFEWCIKPPFKIHFQFDFKEKKTGLLGWTAQLGESLVPRRGLEPPRFYPQVPETCVSTNSTTSA